MADLKQSSLTKQKAIEKAVAEYLSQEKVPQHRQYIEALVKENRQDELERLLCKRLTFGTAGIRGCMGPGYGQMNDLVIIQTSQGMVSYLLELDRDKVLEKGVIIGHDARHNSARFARLAALAFLQRNIPVYFCDHIVPTPLIAFGVKHYSCYAGIVVTASHNPKQDNGYKVYWTNGAQILSPHDRKIQEHIVKPENQQPWPQAWQHETLPSGGPLSSSLTSLTSLTSLPSLSAPTTTTTTAAEPSKGGWNEKLLTRVHGDLSKAYFSYIEDIVGDRRQDNQRAGICITFTAMHGVGHMYLSRALDIAGFEDIFPVESQKKPDPDFSTVKFPNPEESGALDMAFETAKHANSRLILANDPDSDRCAAALYEPESDYKRILNGNEIGALLGWWRWHCFWQLQQQRNDSNNTSNNNSDNAPTSSGAPPSKSSTTTTTGVADVEEPRSPPLDASQSEGSTQEQYFRHKPADCYMISSAVSSKILQSMARVEGFQFAETLTGFKHMANLADRLIKDENKLVLFAFEEAIGYMVDSTILDKDGISAAVQLAQCAAYVANNFDRTLEQQLDWIYTLYGYHYSLNSYYTCSNAAIIREIFTNLQKDYPKSFASSSPSKKGTAGCSFRVTRVRDLNSGYDSSTPDKRAELPSSSSSYMLTFFVEDDITFTIRTSGTEPKIKYYSEIVANLAEFVAGGTWPLDSNEQKRLEAAKQAARQRLQRLVEAAIERCLRPNHYSELEPAGGSE